MVRTHVCCTVLCSIWFYIIPGNLNSLLHERYILQTKSGTVNQDNIISKVTVDRKLQCAVLCSQLQECLLYLVSLHSDTGSSSHLCQMSRDDRWTYNTSHGIAIYIHTERERMRETSTQSEVTSLAPCVCLNGGSCSYADSTPVCACVGSYTGPQCGTHITDPPEVTTTLAPCICQNGGTCSYVGNTPKCECHQVYEGAQCETHITECSTPPFDGISTSNQYFEFTIINRASEKVHVYSVSPSELIQAISDGGGEWSTEGVKVGSRIYFLNENENKYMPFQTSDGTWHCWVDLPSNVETFTARDSFS